MKAVKEKPDQSFEKKKKPTDPTNTELSTYMNQKEVTNFSSSLAGDYTSADREGR